MASLKSYVEKFLLNPVSSFHTDEDGNKETKAQVVDSISGEEGAGTSSLSVSKLRARNAALHSEKDPRYQGKKVTRKDITQAEDSGNDPELQKYFVIGDDDDDDDDSDDNDEDDNKEGRDDGGDDEGSDDEGSDEDESDEGDSDEGDSEEEGTIGTSKKEKNKSPGLIYEGNFNQFAEDFESEDDESEKTEESDQNNVDEIKEETKIDDVKETGGMKTFSSQDYSQDIKKGQYVKNQLSIYDSSFESRIIMQKVLSGMNQLPQPNTYKYFLKENDENYNKNIVSARSSAKKLTGSLLDLQELLLKQNIDTKHILSGGKPKKSGTESNEEITSSEDEKIGENDGSKNIGKKRKLKVKEYEEILSKRHKEFIPFRDATVNKWHERTKLFSHKGGKKSGDFGSFEVSALQHIYNLLSNKPKLIKRTQFTGTTRGIAYRVLGKKETDSENIGEEYDPEIFDDSDYYTRALEVLLKSKVILTDDMNTVSRKLTEIQDLRRKTKQLSEQAYRNKIRKSLNHEVHSTLIQFLGMCKPAAMEDAAMNILFSSLFGKALRSQQDIQKVES